MILAEILRSSDQSFLVRFGNTISDEFHRQVMSYLSLLEEKKLAGVFHIQPAYSSILIRFNLLKISPEKLLKELEGLLKDLETKKTRPLQQNKKIEIPVCYDEIFAPDLKELATYHKMTPEEVIHLHSSSLYKVFFLGFMPGFGYLEGLHSKLKTPRLNSARPKVPAGSVGIAGHQTGIYPHSTPGGWRLIGRTPLKMFDLARHPMSLLAPGDEVKFRPISKKTFEEMEIP
jgi:inhibitor of KinA